MNENKKQTIVFTNGIFDILHRGHIDLLKFAKNSGDKLIVGLNSDRSTKLLKGDDRPIYSQEDRKKILMSIRYVDEVVIFDDTETIDIIKEIKPNVVVKGGEWTAEEVRQRDKIPKEISVKIFPLIEGRSTTDTLKKIKKAESYDKGGLNK